MKKLIILFFCISSLYASGKIGFGAGFDISPNAARISLRNWISKTSGFELGFGPTAYMEDFIFNDMSIQGKYMYGFRYDGYLRTYAGAIARYTLVKDPRFHKNLPSGGIFAGNEWYLGKYKNQGIAIEGGVMYGRISRTQYIQDPNVEISRYYKEFPLYLTFSYKFYFR
ncbi:MAG: hypothetical protein JXR31_05640 [Prolixibacteraceae bacterium]|nr:hypothetical protein [Prolixibacteraceae bacterium]MBN2773710.1 hypothetical protein [Prolixibacteraceae bacterium]